jgi:small nuclear ribonucleoprotein (snRNP)-like protein
MNMVLRDVEESYTVLLRIAKPQRSPAQRAASAAAPDSRAAAGRGDGGAGSASGAAPPGDDARDGGGGGPDKPGGGVLGTGGRRSPRGKRDIPEACGDGEGASSGGHEGPAGVDAAADGGAAQRRGEAAPTDRLVPKQEHRHRRLKQVFVRGDSVVLVAVLTGDS